MPDQGKGGNHGRADREGGNRHRRFEGIGAAVAASAKAGAAVAVNYATSKADVDRVVGDIIKPGHLVASLNRWSEV